MQLGQLAVAPLGRQAIQLCGSIHPTQSLTLSTIAVQTGEVIGISSGIFSSVQVTASPVVLTGFLDGAIVGIISSAGVSVPVSISVGTLVGNQSGSFDGVAVTVQPILYAGDIKELTQREMIAILQTRISELEGLLDMVDANDFAAAVLQKLVDSGVTAQIDLAALESSKSRKMQTNKAVMSSNGTSVLIYDDDGTTLLHEFEITTNRLVRTPI